MLTEREKTGNGAPDAIQEVATDISLPANLERREGVQSIPSNFTAQVHQGNQPLITNQNTPVTVTIPADQATLVQNVKKGNIVDAATWFFAFWLRALKKAIHIGANIVVKPTNQ